MQEIATLVNSLAMTDLVLHVIARVLAPAAISYGLPVIASERSERGNLSH